MCIDLIVDCVTYEWDNFSIFDFPPDNEIYTLFGKKRVSETCRLTIIFSQIHPTPPHPQIKHFQGFKKASPETCFGSPIYVHEKTQPIFTHQKNQFLTFKYSLDTC